MHDPGGALKDSSMIARHLCDIQMGLYASPEYLASIGGVDSPDDLSQFRRLSWFSGRSATRSCGSWSPARSVSWCSPAMECSSTNPTWLFRPAWRAAASALAPHSRWLDSYAQGNLFRYCRNGTFCGAGACHLPGLQAPVGSCALLCELGHGAVRGEPRDTAHAHRAGARVRPRATNRGPPPPFRGSSYLPLSGVRDPDARLGGFSPG